MNIYLLELKEFDYDEYNAWVVIAENKEEVLKICEIKKDKKECDKHFFSNQYLDNVKTIKLIGIAKDRQKRGIVLGSYNAG